MAGSDPGVAPAALLEHADAAAMSLRRFVRSLSDAAGCSPVAELRRQTGAMLHDTTLQAVEYLAGDGYGAELTGDEIRAIAAEAATELRRSLFRAVDDEHCELVAGLRRVVAAARLPGDVDVRLVVGDVGGRVRDEQAVAVIGAVREALNNARKHAQASRIVVRCEPVGDGCQVSVEDDGVGIDPATMGVGLGLRRSIFERMRRCGGRADLRSAPGEGTLVTLTTARAREAVA